MLYNPERFYDLLKTLIEQLPSTFVMLVCMLVAVIRWKRHPRASLLILLGLGWLIAQGFVSAVVYNWFPFWLIQTGRSSDSARHVYLVLGLLTNVSVAGAFTLLLTAIFTQRSFANKPV